MHTYKQTFKLGDMWEAYSVLREENEPKLSPSSPPKLAALSWLQHDK